MKQTPSRLAHAGSDRPDDSPTWLVAISAPLVRRIKRSEGGLWVVNAALAGTNYPIAEAAWMAAASLLCLVSLYLFNDIVDAPADRLNPKKDQSLVAMYSARRYEALVAWGVLTAAALSAFFLIDIRSGIWASAVTVVNLAYSLFFKGVSVWDAVTVGVWGATYSATVSSSPPALGMVGAMTAICHLYQTSEDRAVDLESGIRTSAALGHRFVLALLCALTAILAACIWSLGSLGGALSFGLFPLYWRVSAGNPAIGWILSKVHFALVLATVLWIDRT